MCQDDCSSKNENSVLQLTFRKWLLCKTPTTLEKNVQPILEKNYNM